MNSFTKTVTAKSNIYSNALDLSRTTRRGASKSISGFSRPGTSSASTMVANRTKFIANQTENHTEPEGNASVVKQEDSQTKYKPDPEEINVNIKT